MEDIDYEQLRQDLIDYFGTAKEFYPAAMMNVIDVEKASNYELIQIAISVGFDLEQYKTEGLSF